MRRLHATSTVLLVFLASLFTWVDAFQSIPTKVFAEDKPTPRFLPPRENPPKPIPLGIPIKSDSPKKDVVDDKPKPAAPRKITIRGKCVDEQAKPVAGVQVRVMEERIPADSKSEPDPEAVRMVAETKSDAMGNFEFSDVETWDPALDPQNSRIRSLTAILPGRASATCPTIAPEGALMELKEPLVLSSDPQTLSGVVTDPSGRPIAGAFVFIPTFFENPMPGMWNSVTDQEGRYSITDLKKWKMRRSKNVKQEDGSEVIEVYEALQNFYVRHPGYVTKRATIDAFPNRVDVLLKPTAFIEGVVIDDVTGKPAASVEVKARGIGYDATVSTRTDKEGRYRLQMTKDYFNIWAEEPDRVAVVLKAIVVTPEAPLKNVDFRLINGEIVTGTVIDRATNKPVVGSDDQPMYVAHYGPACLKSLRPIVQSIGGPPLSVGVQQTTKVDRDGTFRLRVAPGSNRIFFLEDHDEVEQSPTILTIEAGREKSIELRVELTRGKERQRSRLWMAGLTDDGFDADLMNFAVLRNNIQIDDAHAALNTAKTQKSSDRIPSRQRRDSTVNRLLDTIERTSFSGGDFGEKRRRAIQEIVDLGPAALPDLFEELEATEDRRMLSTLGYLLRTIDDARAVPALIRAIPKLAATQASNEILRRNDDSNRIPVNGMVFSKDDTLRYTGPHEQICETLIEMTATRHGEFELRYALWDHSTSPRQLRLKRELFHRVAQEWATWWEQHWKEFTDDEDFSGVRLPPLPPEDSAVPTDADAVDPYPTWTSVVLESVLDPDAKNVFYDLDTCRTASLPDKWRNAKKIESHLDEIMKWAEGEGFDLMGTEYVAPETGRRVAAVQPTGLEAEEMHYESTTEYFPSKLADDANTGPLLYYNRETGSIEPTSRAYFNFSTKQRTSGMLFIGLDENPIPDKAQNGDAESKPGSLSKGRRVGLMRSPPRTRNKAQDDE